MSVRSPVRSVVRDAVRSVIWGESGGSPPAVPEAFTLVMRTTGAAETVTLPMTGIVDVTIDWGDGSSVENFTTSSPSHEYATAGDYEVKITGSASTFAFNNGGDKLKVRSVSGIGQTFSIASSFGVFSGCTNMTSADLSGIAVNGADVARALFLNCSSMTSAVLFDLSAQTSLFNMLRGCTALASDPGLVSADITSATSMSNMLLGSNNALSTAEYDAILVAWEAQSVQNNVSAHFGDATYTSGSAADTARTALANDHSWTIVDAGAAP